MKAAAIRRRLPDNRYGDWSGPLGDSRLAASGAGERATRDWDRAYLKRPGRGVPPPRSGPPLLVAGIVTSKSHALFDQCRGSVAMCCLSDPGMPTKTGVMHGIRRGSRHKE